MVIRNVAFEGGGMKGMVYMGCCKFLYTHKMLGDIKAVSGSSIGAVFVLLLVILKSCEITMDDLESIVLSFNLSKLFKFPSVLEYPQAVSTFMDDFGVMDGIVMENVFGEILKKYFGKSEISFIELYEKTGVEMVLTGTNLSKMRTDFFSHVTDPDMWVKHAMRISCTYPFVFKPVMYHNNMYVDGGLYHNFPITYWDKDTQNNETIGFSITTKEVRDRTFPDITNVTDYSFRIINSMIENINEKNYTEYDPLKRITKNDYRNIEIVTSDTIDASNFDLPLDDLETLYAQGFNTTASYFEIKERIDNNDIDFESKVKNRDPEPESCLSRFCCCLTNCFRS